MTIPSFNIQPGESPAAVSERRKIAMLLMKEGMDTSPIRHPLQGAARMAQALMGGMELNRADQTDRDSAKKLANALVPLDAPVSASAGSAPAAAPVAPMPKPGVPMASTTGKVYSNDEPSPLDPPSGGERDLAVRTVLAEAGNQGPTGMQAVASVLRNRAVNGGFGGDTPTGVITKPFQFEPMNTPAGRQRMAAYDPNSPAYQNADAALTRAYAGEDPTSGATHFYAPKAQAALGRPAPSWDNGQGVNIGDHRFFGGTGTPPVVAGMTPDAVSSQSRAPQAPAPQPAAALSTRNAPMIPPEMAQRLHALISDPATSSYGLQLAAQFIKPSQSQFVQIGEDDMGNKQFGFVDPVTQKVVPYQAAQGATPGQPAPPPGQPAPPRTVPGPDGRPIAIPEGVDKKQFRKTVTEETANAATGKLTESQGKALQFANRMETAEGQLGAVENEGVNAGQRAWAAADASLGAAGFGVPRGQLSEGYKTFDTARSQWITALLRRESGAAISPSEFTRYDREFFPQPGDSAAQITQKREARRVATEAMKKEAGGSYQSPQVASRGPQVGAVEDGYRFKGGNPADPASWERMR